jgi:hypothetical protein
MTAETFLPTITASASFLKLPAASQQAIQMHAARFGQASTSTAPTAALTIKPSTASPGEFRAMNGHARGVFLAAGGVIAAETMNRTEFNKLSHRQKSDFCKNGGRLTD